MNKRGRYSNKSVLHNYFPTLSYCFQPLDYCLGWTAFWNLLIIYFVTNCNRVLCTKLEYLTIIFYDYVKIVVQHLMEN